MTAVRGRANHGRFFEMAVLAGTFLEILLFGLLIFQTWRREVETNVQKADEEFRCPREWSAQGARSHDETRGQVLGGVEIVSSLAIFSECCQ